MLIYHHIDQECPSCKCRDHYGNVLVSGNRLLQGCSSCGFHKSVNLPILSKRILYLDQSFLSHAFRGHLKNYVDAAKRIMDLATKQLIVCPWSAIHELETHQWRNDQRDNLWLFIKRTSHYQYFKQPVNIKLAQVYRSYLQYIHNDQSRHIIKRSDALKRDIDDWDSYIAIDIGHYAENIEVIRANKERSIYHLTNSFDRWQQTPCSFSEDVMAESIGYANSLIDAFNVSHNLLTNGNFDGWMHSPSDSMIIESILRVDNSTLQYHERLIRVRAYLSSTYFCNNPHVEIMCRLYAYLHSMVYNGHYPNRSKARQKLSGLFYDVESISLYGPYCDAIFVDQEMRRWVTDHDVDFVNRHNTKVYSAYTWDEFHDYLDSVEADVGEEHNQFIQLVYG